jgi:two-component system LytT family response regulator
MISAVLVDDEKKARDTIASILKLYCPGVTIAGQADSVKKAIEIIDAVKPRLVLLDIDMPGANGFELLRHYKSAAFKIIFITAYEEYAVKAFKFSALDYILKPINPDELIDAVNRAGELIDKEQLDMKLESFMINIENITREVKKIVLKTAESIHVINVPDIVRCEADRNYTIFHISDGRKILVSNTLKEYDEMLSSYRFFRAHQSHLVNINYIERFEKKLGGFLMMKDRSQVPVSVRKKEMLLQMLENI